MNTCIFMIMFWLVGYGLAFGTDKQSLYGTSHFAGSGFKGTHNIADWGMNSILKKCSMLPSALLPIV